MTFDFSPWRGQSDFTFIDGGHDYDTVKADSENALTLARTDKPAAIFWHDYNRAEYSGLSYYMDTLSKDLPMIRIGDTSLCVWFNELARKKWGSIA